MYNIFIHLTFPHLGSRQYMTRFTAKTEKRITLTLDDRTSSLSTTEAKELVYELAKILDLVVTESKTTKPTVLEWLTRDDFDRVVTKSVAEHFAHRAWNALSLFGADRIVQVKCGVCGLIVNRNHKLASDSGCEGSREYSKSMIEVSSLIAAYDNGTLFDPFYKTQGSKVAKAITELVTQLKTR